MVAAGAACPPRYLLGISALLLRSRPIIAMRDGHFPAAHPVLVRLRPSTLLYMRSDVHSLHRLSSRVSQVPDSIDKAPDKA